LDQDGHRPPSAGTVPSCCAIRSGAIGTTRPRPDRARSRLRCVGQPRSGLGPDVRSAVRPTWH